MSAAHEIFVVLTLDDCRLKPLNMYNLKIRFLSPDLAKSMKVFQSITYANFYTQEWKPYCKKIIKTCLDRFFEDDNSDLLEEECLFSELIADDPEFL